MRTTVDFYDFKRAFEACRPEHFSAEGLGILFDGLEEFEDDIGEEMELDVIAICCDFCEMTAEDVLKAYNLDENEDVVEFLNMNTWLMGETKHGSYVFRQF